MRQVDRRDKKVSTLFSLPRARNGIYEEVHNNGTEKFGIPAFVGNNIAVHPNDRNVIALCDADSVLIYDLKNCKKPISSIPYTIDSR